MQLHIRLKWSKVRPWKGVGIYHTQCSCAQLSLAPVTRRLFGSVLKPELSLLQKTWHCSPKNPKTNINNDKKQNKKHTATHKKAQYKNTQKKAAAMVLPSLLFRDPALLRQFWKTDLFSNAPEHLMPAAKKNKKNPSVSDIPPFLCNNKCPKLSSALKAQYTPSHFLIYFKH